MIKKLKTIKQLQKEFITVKKLPVELAGYPDAINLKNVDGGFEGKILKRMFKFFGESIEVEKYENRSHGLRNYDWRIIDYNVKYYFQDNWFENNIKLLEDSLFEI
jgi:hypothetical protein